VGGEHVVAVVSHGILLSVLWRRLLSRMPPNSVTLHPEILVSHGKLDLERLGGWSNTGYLELEMRHSVIPLPPVTPSTFIDPVVALDLPEEDKMPQFVEAASTLSAARFVPTNATTDAKTLSGWTTTVRSINSRKHLVGLKRTRGGVGSASHDESQQSIEFFFKKQKKE
jgi:hypothetical protein